MASSDGGPARSLVTTPAEVGMERVRRARNARRAGLAILALLVVAGLSTALGPRTTTASASAGGYRLAVTNPATSRPGLAIRWIAVVSHPGGFTDPITIATDSGYFNLFDFNNLDPVPTGQTTTADESFWTFDPPPGDVFRVTLDGRIEPAQQFGKSATTVLKVEGVRVVEVHYTTTVMP
jgi:hypothetical protein